MHKFILVNITFWSRSSNANYDI